MCCLFFAYLVENSLLMSMSNNYALLDASTHLYKRVCPSVCPFVGPSITRFFFKELIIGEIDRKWMGKQSKSLPYCPKMSTSDASLSERTCSFIIWIHFITILSDWLFSNLYAPGQNCPVPPWPVPCAVFAVGRGGAWLGVEGNLVSVCTYNLTTDVAIN